MPQVSADIDAFLTAANNAAARTALGAAAASDIIFYDPAITGRTGGGATKLDGIVTVGVEAGRVQMLISGTEVYFYVLFAGTNSESSPTVILPDDYHASTNAKHWALSSAQFDTLYARNIVLDDYTAGFYASFNASDSITDHRDYNPPDAAGVMSLFPIVTEVIPLTGDTISTSRYVDETTLIIPAGALAALTLNLPITPNNRLGQIKTFFSRQNVTAVTVGAGTTIYGTALTALTANESYSFQCVNPSGDVWIRLS